MSNHKTRTWAAGNLRPGQRVICPGDGAPERVIGRAHRAGKRWAFRTERHDHFMPVGAKVEVVVPAPASPS